MKTKAQLTVAVLFLLSFIKSFKYSSNLYDVVFILVCACIYLVYEFISNKKIQEQVSKLAIDTEERFKGLDKEVRETKNYVSTMSLGQTYRK
jgi:uncharacterized membrane protein